MKNPFIFLTLFASSLALTSCEIVGDIFKAGMWFGIIGVALVVGIIMFILSKIRG